MPFCTGCTLFGHILNLQGSSTPFEPLVSSPKMKLRNIRWKFPHSIFGFAGECTYRILICICRCFREAFCKSCGLYRWQIISRNVKTAVFAGCFGRKNLLNTCRIFGGIIDGGFVKGNLRMEKVKVGFLTIRPILGSILLSFERF